MIIVVNVAAYYDWVPLPDGVSPTSDDAKKGYVKEMHDGSFKMRIQKDAATHTTVSISELEIADNMAHFEQVGSPKTRAQLVAWYLQSHTMPHHSHPKHFLKITVHDDGPNEPIFRSALQRFADLPTQPSIPSARIPEIIADYVADSTDVELFLNQYFNTASYREQAKPSRGKKQ